VVAQPPRCRRALQSSVFGLLIHPADQGATAFIDSATLPSGQPRISAAVAAHLAAAGVELRPYDAISDAIAAMRRPVTSATISQLLRLTPGATGGADAGARGAAAATGADASAEYALFIDPAGCSLAISSATKGLPLVEAKSPVQVLKAVKSAAELACMERCHLRDSAALCRYFAWLDDTMVAGAIRLDEVSASEQLEAIRSMDPLWKGPSFPTISSAGANGAIIHYHPSHDPRTPLSVDEVYLCDSGAHYLDGTTDVTRTFWFGSASDSSTGDLLVEANGGMHAEAGAGTSGRGGGCRVSTAPARVQACYTRVLQAHIALDRAVFPPGTTGQMLDPLARVCFLSHLASARTSFSACPR
jgi:Xaa-Pro aminopeptidase